LVKEIAWRLFGGADFLLSLLGILPPKKLRRENRVLRDLDGRALLGDEELDPATRALQLDRGPPGRLLIGGRGTSRSWSCRGWMWAIREPGQFLPGPRPCHFVSRFPWRLPPQPVRGRSSRSG
jgi:hypothetical protein